MHYWICNTTPENWLLCWNDLSYGVPESSRSAYGLEQISQVKKGDGIFFYVSKRGLLGYFTAKSEICRDRNRQGADRVYPHFIKLEEKKVLSDPVNFSEIKGKIYNNKSMTPISDPQSLRGKSMIPLSLKDANYLLPFFKGG